MPDPITERPTLRQEIAELYPEIPWRTPRPVDEARRAEYLRRKARKAAKREGGTFVCPTIEMDRG